MTTRRQFLSQGALTAAALSGVPHVAEATATTTDGVKGLQPPAKPVIVTRVTGDQTIEAAYQMLLDGVDTLEAIHHICLGRENDPTDHSVGLGGLPNEEGIVELDASCMHGPTRRAGAVGGVRNIRNVCLVSRKVMERTGHVMMAGEGAEQFAVAEGFKREDLLTEDARKIWLLWKENPARQSSWGPGLSSPDWKDPDPSSEKKSSLMIPRRPGPEWSDEIQRRTKVLTGMAADLGIAPERRLYAAQQILWPTTGTIHVSAVNPKGEMSGATTTSGLAFKIPGRLGDSPVIGAGCYTDQDVGSAGATGSGEENIKVAGAHTIVELMRHGMTPKEAGLEALRRIVRNYNSDIRKLRYVDMIYYIVRKDGAYAGCSLWGAGPTGKQRHFAVHDGTMRVEECAALLQEGSSIVPPL
jgi:N4-(beta-N-acetylglucosaminyl)-L-asparaginase